MRVLPILAVVGTLVFAAPATAAPTVVSFVFTGAPQTFTVPPGVVSASFTVTGAGGESTIGGGGGAGGRATATLPLTPGDAVSVFVGGGGASAGAFNGGGTSGLGGGGGGATDIRIGGQTVADRVLVAGGGGGGGICPNATGGAGGGATGAPGSIGTAICPPGSDGGGGTQTAGGAGGTTGGTTAGGGGFGSGGGGSAGGGGGGGWFGGGAGQGGGGGGGSGHGPAGTQFVSGVNGGAGTATITYDVLDVVAGGAGRGYVNAAPGTIDCGVADGSRTACQGGYSPGSSVKLIAHPAAGSELAGFSSNCVPVTGRPEECTVTMADAATVTATFIRSAHTLTVVTHGGGAGFVDAAPSGVDCGQGVTGHDTCASEYADGASVVLTAHPADGSDFTGFNGAGCGAGATCTVTMDQARAVAAGFALTATPGPPQTVQQPGQSATGGGGATLARLRLGSRRVRVVKGRALITVRCAAADGQSCRGSVALAPRRGTKGTGRTTGFTVAAGRSRTVKVRLTRALRAALAKRSRTGARAVLALDGAAAQRLSITLLRR